MKDALIEHDMVTAMAKRLADKGISHNVLEPIEPGDEAYDGEVIPRRIRVELTYRDWDKSETHTVIYPTRAGFWQVGQLTNVRDESILHTLNALGAWRANAHHPTPRLRKLMQFMGALSEGEAHAAIRDYRKGYEYSSEAVNNYGGTTKLIRAAIQARTRLRSLYVPAKTVPLRSQYRPDQVGWSCIIRRDLERPNSGRNGRWDVVLTLSRVKLDGTEYHTEYVVQQGLTRPAAERLQYALSDSVGQIAVAFQRKGESPEHRDRYGIR